MLFEVPARSHNCREIKIDLYFNSKADHMFAMTQKKKKERATGGKKLERHKNILDKKS